VHGQSRRLLSLVFSEAGFGAGAGNPPRPSFPLLLGVRTELATRDRVLGTASCGPRGMHGVQGDAC